MQDSRVSTSNPSLLEFQIEAGQILLKDYRMVLSSSSALGALRREFVETLGTDSERAIMKRVGHAAGLADGLAPPQASLPNSMRSKMKRTASVKRSS